MIFHFPKVGYVFFPGENQITPDVWTDLKGIESLTSQDEVEDPGNCGLGGLDDTLT